MKRVIALCFVAVLFLVGCASQAQPYRPTSVPDVTISVNTQSGAQPVDEKLPEASWIYPGKITVDNLYKGARAESYIRMQNRTMQRANLKLEYRESPYTANPIPVNAQSWIQVAKPNESWTPLGGGLLISLAAYEIAEYNLAIEIPRDYEKIPPKWSYWIVLTPVTDAPNMIIAELAQTWNINMRSN